MERTWKAREAGAGISESGLHGLRGTFPKLAVALLGSSLVACSSVLRLVRGPGFMTDAFPDESLPEARSKRTAFTSFSWRMAHNLQPAYAAPDAAVDAPEEARYEQFACAKECMREARGRSVYLLDIKTLC